MEVNLLSVSDDGNVDRILERHLVELRGVKLTDETLAANGVYSETDPDKIAKLLNWPGSAKQLGPVLVFPYFDRDGQPLDHVTVKPDRPRDDKKKLGKKIKYENPKGPPNRVYIPVCARHALADPKADLFLSEGCKKAARRHTERLSVLVAPWCMGLVCKTEAEERQEGWQARTQCRPGRDLMAGTGCLHRVRQ